MSKRQHSVVSWQFCTSRILLGSDLWLTNPRFHKLPIGYQKQIFNLFSCWYEPEYHVNKMKHFQISQIKGKYQIFNHRCLNQTKKSNNGGELLFALMNPLPQTFCSKAMTLFLSSIQTQDKRNTGNFIVGFAKSMKELSRLLQLK